VGRVFEAHHTSDEVGVNAGVGWVESARPHADVAKIFPIAEGR
jgi:hypothetical protein